MEVDYSRSRFHCCPCCLMLQILMSMMMANYYCYFQGLRLKYRYYLKMTFAYYVRLTMCGILLLLLPCLLCAAYTVVVAVNPLAVINATIVMKQTARYKVILSWFIYCLVLSSCTLL